MIYPQLVNDFTPVQILDNENFEILFSSAHPMRLSVIDEKRATRFKVEDGGERSDHVIKNAIEINIELTISGANAKQHFQSLQQAFLENKLVIVQSKMQTYENMLIEALPHEETQEIYEGAIVPVRLIEWRSVSAEYGELQQQQQAPQELTQRQTAEPAQTSTVKRGTQSGRKAEPGGETERKGSVLSGWGLI